MLESELTHEEKAQAISNFIDIMVSCDSDHEANECLKTRFVEGLEEELSLDARLEYLLLLEVIITKVSAFSESRREVLLATLHNAKTVLLMQSWKGN